MLLWGFVAVIDNRKHDGLRRLDRSLETKNQFLSQIQHVGNQGQKGRRQPLSCVPGHAPLSTFNFAQANTQNSLLSEIGTVVYYLTIEQRKGNFSQDIWILATCKEAWRVHRGH
jgi:hypothetical protein